MVGGATPLLIGVVHPIGSAAQPGRVTCLLEPHLVGTPAVECVGGDRRPFCVADREVRSVMASDAGQDKAPLAPAHRNNWFVVERPTDTGGGTVFVKPPVPGNDRDLSATDESTD
jgi:hypothetical protein